VDGEHTKVTRIKDSQFPSSELIRAYEYYLDIDVGGRLQVRGLETLEVISYPSEQMIESLDVVPQWHFKRTAPGFHREGPVKRRGNYPYLSHALWDLQSAADIPIGSMRKEISHAAQRDTWPATVRNVSNRDQYRASSLLWYMQLTRDSPSVHIVSLSTTQHQVCMRESWEITGVYRKPSSVCLLWRSLAAWATSQ